MTTGGLGFVTGPATALDEPRCAFSLGMADRPLVAAGQRVAVGDALFERVEDLSILRTSVDATAAPGDALDPASLGGAAGHRRPRAIDRATLLYRDASGTAVVCVGHFSGQVESVIDGVVESVDASAVVVRADGVGLRVALAWGSPVRGRIQLAVPSLHADLRAGDVDAGADGALLVAGARVDIEALTRARALGARGVICGGIAGRDLAQLAASEARQRASVHPPAPFGLAVIVGYGRRPMSSGWWQRLAAAEGTEAAMLGDPAMVVLGVESVDAVERGTDGRVRVAAGAEIGREGQFREARGAIRTGAGTYAAAGLVELDGQPDGAPELRVIPLAELERLG